MCIFFFDFFLTVCNWIKYTFWSIDKNYFKLSLLTNWKDGNDTNYFLSQRSFYKNYTHTPLIFILYGFLNNIKSFLMFFFFFLFF